MDFPHPALDLAGTPVAAVQLLPKQRSLEVTQRCGRQFLKIQLQNIFIRFSAEAPDTLALRVQLSPHRLLDAELRHRHQRSGIGIAVYFL